MFNRLLITVGFILSGIILTQCTPGTSESDNSLKFDFGNGKVEKGYTQVTGDMVYNKERGYGFVCETTVEDLTRANESALLQDFCTSSKPFYFQIDVPEGDYKVKITYGDEEGPTIMTVKAESRRLMIKSSETKAGEHATKTITINSRRPVMQNGDSINLKSREYPYLNWDSKLNLEFNNSRTCINAIEITKVHVPKILLAGNSTVTDQEHEPWCSWGQMITYFLSDDIVVENLAESGETLKSFKARGRLRKLIEELDSGDYVFIEFGHNDQKPNSSSYVKPWEGYQDEIRDYIAQVRAKGGNPVLVTPTARRHWDENGELINTHGDYPAAMKQVAEQESVPLIDLNSLSKVLYRTMGVEESKKALVHYPANTYPNQDKPLADDTHFNPYGAYQLAKCIVQGIIDLDLDLKKYIINFDSYDPAKPDDWTTFHIPESPLFEAIKPDGN